MIYSHKRKDRHNTMYTVKILSGPQKGAKALVGTASEAKAECFYQADVLNTCATWYPPIYSNEISPAEAAGIFQ